MLPDDTIGAASCVLPPKSSDPSYKRKRVFGDELTNHAVGKSDPDPPSGPARVTPVAVQVGVATDDAKEEADMRPELDPAGYEGAPKDGTGEQGVAAV